MSGISNKSDSQSRQALRVARRLAEQGARQYDTSLIGSGLRLFDAEHDEQPEPDEGTDQGAITPFDLGYIYERLLAPAKRRSTGVHLTPEAVARQLVRWTPASWSEAPNVLDPAVGGGAFLLAAADEQLHAGVDVETILRGVKGIDIDPGAVAVAEAALGLWAIEHGHAPRRIEGLRVGDGLCEDLPAANVVLGNPPFLNQLRERSASSADRRATLTQRWGELKGAYTDDAWLFLAAGIAALEAGGTLAMVQPLSVLGAKHAAPIRQFVADHAVLEHLWVGRDRVFEASVQVCGLVASQRSSDSGGAHPLRRWSGIDFEANEPLPDQPDPERWGVAAAVALRVPTVEIDAPAGATLADLADATAGFRDQFYGFVPFVSEAADPTADHARLVTVGMIDPLRLLWGERQFRFAKREFTRPVIDVAALAAQDPRLAAWVEARDRPKVLVATQTKVVEAWADVEGSAIPATPVISIEPHDRSSDTLWQLAAAVSAPPVSAYLAARSFGKALAIEAIKVSATDVLGIPMPVNERAWRRGAELAAELQSTVGTPPATLIAEFASTMTTAYDIVSPDLQRWWISRRKVERSAPYTRADG